MKITQCIFKINTLMKNYQMIKFDKNISLANVKEIVIPEEFNRSFITKDDLEILHYYRLHDKEFTKSFLESLYKSYNIDKTKFRICLLDGEIQKR